MSPTKKNSDQHSEPKNTLLRRKRGAKVTENELPKSIRKSKVIKFSDPDGKTYCVDLVNQFEILKNADADMDVQPSTSQLAPRATNNFQQQAKKNVAVPSALVEKVRIPPINVRLSASVAKSTISKVLKELSLTSFSTKFRNNTELSVFTTTTEDFKKIRETFATHKFPWYTHDLPEEKFFKVFVKGLEDSSADELQQVLTTKGFKPESVKAIPPKIIRYEGHMNYVLYFKKGTVRLEPAFSQKLIFRKINQL